MQAGDLILVEVGLEGSQGELHLAHQTLGGGLNLAAREALPDRARALATLTVEVHEQWQEGSRYLNMRLLAEQKKEQMRRYEEAA